MELIDSNDYDWIRKRIDGGVTQATVPPDQIESYIEEAADWVGARVDIDALEEAKLAHAKRAAKYYVASLIAPTVTIPTSDSVSGVGASYTRKVLDPDKNATRLLLRAVEEIEEAASNTTPATTVMPTFFAAAKGCRGR